MTQKIFDILSQINAEGIENGIWSMYDLHEQNSREFFGTDENKIIDGKVLVLYVDVNDSFCFVRTETADEMLTIKNVNSPYPTALMIWYL